VHGGGTADAEGNEGVQDKIMIVYLSWSKVVRSHFNSRIWPACKILISYSILNWTLRKFDARQKFTPSESVYLEQGIMKSLTGSNNSVHQLVETTDSISGLTESMSLQQRGSGPSLSTIE